MNSPNLLTTHPRKNAPFLLGSSVEQYHQMIRQGIFGENDSIELIRGEVVQKRVIGNRHAACVKQLNRILSRGLPESALVSVQDILG